jgi:hypothetical protein
MVGEIDPVNRKNDITLRQHETTVRQTRLVAFENAQLCDFALTQVKCVPTQFDDELNRGQFEHPADQTLMGQCDNATMPKGQRNEPKTIVDTHKGCVLSWVQRILRLRLCQRPAANEKQPKPNHGC